MESGFFSSHIHNVNRMSVHLHVMNDDMKFEALLYASTDVVLGCMRPKE